MSDDAVISDGLGEFLARKVPGEWAESRDGPRLQCELASEDDEPLAWSLARALAQYLVIFHERAWLNELLRRRYHVFDAKEKKAIVDRVLHLLHTDREQDLARVDLAAASIFQYVVTEPVLVLDGIRTFLLGDIRTEFEEAIDQAVESHLMEEEYQEFVHLLRQLVNVAGTRQEWIHVLFEHGRFFFEDSEGRRLGEDLVQDMLQGVDGADGGLDDVLISALVTLAPTRITVHQGHLADEGRETLLEVFDGRVLFCRGCAKCYRLTVDRDWRSF